ncbi:uncharacterized protein [Maniola hyperantus]|uniref:uncharacterized protein n=1 Tax=Aphantopus hyperantus TaxID=2795564 RepID=UPI0037496B90
MSNENYLKEFDKAVTRWNIQFDTTGDAVEFLERIEELTETLGVDRNKIIHLIPRCLSGRASLWYRNNKLDWKSWKDFTDNFKLYYFPRDYERNLLETIINRRQKHRENFIDYLTDLKTLMRRYGKMKSADQLDRIYDNMNPNYKLYIKSKDFSTLRELIELATEYEKITSNQDKYNSPDRPMSDHGHSEIQLSLTEINAESPKEIEPRAEKRLIYPNYDPQACCWKCGKKNHSSQECRGKQIIFCSQCGLLGKLTRNCCKKTGDSSKTKPEAYTANTQGNGDNRIFVNAKIYGKTFSALVDTGSTSTFINKEIMDRIKGNVKGITEKQNKIGLADGSEINTDKLVNIELEVNGQNLMHEVTYLPSTTAMIIGMDLLHRLGLTIVWKKPLRDNPSTQKPAVQNKAIRLPEQQIKYQTVRTVKSENSEKINSSSHGLKPIKIIRQTRNHKETNSQENINKYVVKSQTREKANVPRNQKIGLNYNWREHRQNYINKSDTDQNRYAEYSSDRSLEKFRTHRKYKRPGNIPLVGLTANKYTYNNNRISTSNVDNDVSIA